MTQLSQLDRRYVWHPFTQMRDWLKREPIVIVEGEGAVLRDSKGREYLDANASIWTNLHGHRNRRMNDAIRRQLGRIAHSSALGLANEPASLLAARLIEVANPPKSRNLKVRPPFHRTSGIGRPAPLAKVFFSDNGSTAVEVALKLAYEFARRVTDNPKPRFISLQGAYHGDTVGAVALGHLDLFHRAYSGLLFKTDAAPSPYCYRCRFNRAKPERADARDYRRCHWECLDGLERQFARQTKHRQPYAAFVFEPLMQGAAGMIPQPAGWLARATAIARSHGVQLIADEVMTGFGRTGTAPVPQLRSNSKPVTNAGRSALFACHQEGVQPDFLALAKGLTGGYLPMAATLTTQTVFNAFLGEYHEFKTFFHGHSYTGNQLAASAALASLDILETQASVRRRLRLERTLREELAGLWSSSKIGDIRQVGLIAGIELMRNWRTREAFDLRDQAGIRVCAALAKLGVLTRPIGNVVVLMPPYCMTPKQVRKVVGSMQMAIRQVLGG